MKHQQATSRWEGTHHIMTKTSLLENVIVGTKAVGWPSLAAKLRALRPAAPEMSVTEATS